MSQSVLKKTDDKSELACEHCGGHFHYDQQRHCWKCDGATCPVCSSDENVCSEGRQIVLPKHIEPMLATMGKLPANSDKWAYEFKWDGIRAISYWNGRHIRVESRNLADITFRYPELHDIGPLFGDNAVIDGEIIAMDSNNRPSFSILQKRMHISASSAAQSLPEMQIYYYVFDLLFLRGHNLMDQPYNDRRHALENLNIIHPSCKLTPSYRGDGKTMLSIAKEHSLEGIVCKKIDSIYSPGTRSDEWIKVKLIKSREFIICGFKYSGDSTKKIGSLQLAAYDNNMKLHFVGSMGTGFSREDHDLLLKLLEPVKINESPFGEKVDKNVNFTKPVYIAQVEYRRWPKNGLLQQSSFKGLRTDKKPAEIWLEEK